VIDDGLAQLLQLAGELRAVDVELLQLLEPLADRARLFCASSGGLPDDGLHETSSSTAMCGTTKAPARAGANVAGVKFQRPVTATGPGRLANRVPTSTPSITINRKCPNCNRSDGVDHAVRRRVYLLDNR
jgi:hypothetical protein